MDLSPTQESLSNWLVAETPKRVVLSRENYKHPHADTREDSRSQGILLQLHPLDCASSGIWKRLTNLKQQEARMSGCGVNNLSLIIRGRRRKKIAFVWRTKWLQFILLYMGILKACSFPNKQYHPYTPNACLLLCMRCS